MNQIYKQLPINFEEDSLREQKLHSQIKEYFKTSANYTLTHEEIIECRQSLIFLGKAISRYYALK
jgi:hypothetical protein